MYTEPLVCIHVVCHLTFAPFLPPSILNIGQIQEKKQMKLRWGREEAEENTRRQIARKRKRKRDNMQKEKCHIKRSKNEINQDLK